MELLNLIILVVVILIVFEFIKHHLVKGSGKIFLSVLVILIIGVLVIKYADVDLGSFTEAKTTGAVVWEDLKDGIEDINLDNSVTSFNTRKAYIALPKL